MRMTKKNKAIVASVVETEEFDYGLNYYADFSEIKDTTFHNLLFLYRQARKDLIEYCELEDM